MYVCMYVCKFRFRIRHGYYGYRCCLYGRGWSAIINDDLIGKTVILSVLSMCLLGAGLGSLMCVLSLQPQEGLGLWAGVGLIIGAITGIILTNKYDFYVYVLYICTVCMYVCIHEVYLCMDMDVGVPFNMYY